jgi:hypothetical protein
MLYSATFVFKRLRSFKAAQAFDLEKIANLGAPDTE